MKFRLLVLLQMLALNCLGQSPARQAVAWYEKGELEFNKGDYSRAIISLTNCLQLNPAYYEAYTIRASARERTGDLKGAITDLSIYLARFPYSKEALLSRAVARYRDTQYDIAIPDFLQVLHLPDTGQTNTIYYRETSGEAGITGITSLQSGMRDQIHYYLALCNTELERYDSALMHIDSALAIQGKVADYHSQKGLIYMRDNENENARQSFEAALAIDPAHAIARHNLNLIAQPDDPAEAEQQLTLAIENNPDRYFTYEERAYHRLEQGNLQGALADYNRAIELKSDAPDMYINRGLVKDRLGDLQGAINDFTLAIRLNDRYEKPWFCRANVLTKQGKLTQAVDDYTVAISNYPSYGAAYYNRAVALQAAGKHAEACSDVRMAESMGVTDGGKLRRAVCK